MRKMVKIGSVLLMVVMLTTFAAALQKSPVQQAGTSGTSSTSSQLVISGADVITAADAGGGYLSTRDII